MTADCALWYELYRLETSYWRDVDFNQGRNATTFYLDDGVFAIGDNVFRGAERISEFYAWRQSHTRATTRHVLSNLMITQAADREAHAQGVIHFYQAEGQPPVWDSSAAILVADLINHCVLDDKNVWRFKSHVLRPIFMGNNVPLSLAFDLTRAAAASTSAAP
jgi:hypothetical protein